MSGSPLLPLLFIALVLLLPRVCGLMSSANSLTASTVAFAIQELVLSSLLAPILMVQRTRMILSLVAGRPSAWEKPKNHQTSLATAIQFHGIEVCLGLVMLAVWFAGQASQLIFAAAVPLLLAPLLNQAVSRRHTRQNWSVSHDKH
jgi:membrane glycosyltransferase